MRGRQYGGSFAVRPEDRPGYVAPALARSLIVGVDRQGHVLWVSSDAERNRGQLPAHMIAEAAKVYGDIPLHASVERGQPFTPPAV